MDLSLRRELERMIKGFENYRQINYADCIVLALKAAFKDEDFLAQVSEDQRFKADDDHDALAEAVKGHRFYRKYQSRSKHVTIVSVQVVSGVLFAYGINDQPYSWKQDYYKPVVIRADRLLNKRYYLDVTYAG